ncbi:MAG: phosphoribosylformylglycinamidine synthase subunit PurS, partial [Candidatus Omnitrophica bacterium]|nr:phosphoribosylformylglycinamidine synthase subunit PurS [Candidatus Omnitrophota bacterium]
MPYKIEVKDKAGIFDAVGNGVKKDILDLGLGSIRQVRFAQVYSIEGNLSAEEIKKICAELLLDKVSQDYSIQRTVSLKGNGPYNVIEVAYNPGVMDPVEDSVLKGIRDLGIDGVSSVKTAKKYYLKGKLTPLQLKTIAEKLLYNKLIQHVVSQEHQAKAQVDYEFKLFSVDLLSASDKRLSEISRKGQLFLNLAEMLQIKKYFQKHGRNPTDCELETLAQTWSEHCCHKTFRGKIRYSEKLSSGTPSLVKATKLIDNLLKSTIMKVTKELNKPWCVSVFKDNSGVIRFDEQYNVCFKVETHNHPSALEPFGGANTGVGGVVRDPLGTGLGAKPILNTDVFCFAPPDLAVSKVPKGSLHPKRVMKGVVSGVRDYGNKMGIPTVNGAILFHERFVGNPLVYCGTAGIMPKDKSFK